nr:segmentation polarity homeobox protein engrailed-like [Ipomoea batatas]
MTATWCLPAGIGLKVAAVHAGVRSPPLLCLAATDEGKGRRVVVAAGHRRQEARMTEAKRMAGLNSKSGSFQKCTMRSFPVFARPPAPATKISLGSKKAEPSKPADPTSDASVPTGLPLATTCPASLGDEHEAARATKRGKDKEIVDIEEVATVKRPRRDGSGSTTPVMDVLMKHGDEPLAALLSRIYSAAPPPEKTSGWSTALVGERIACDLIQMAHSVTDLFARVKDGDEIHRREVAPLKKSLAKREGQETGEAVLAAISRTPIGEDLMCEFGSWAFNSGRRAMQNDVRTALEVAMDDDDLPKVLAVLPEEMPDPGPTPFSRVPKGRTLPVPVVEISAVPSVEVAAPAGPTAESASAPNAGPSAEGDAEPLVEQSAEAKRGCCPEAPLPPCGKATTANSYRCCHTPSHVDRAHQPPPPSLLCSTAGDLAGAGGSEAATLRVADDRLCSVAIAGAAYSHYRCCTPPRKEGRSLSPPPTMITHQCHHPLLSPSRLGMAEEGSRDALCSRRKE